VKSKLNCNLDPASPGSKSPVSIQNKRPQTARNANSHQLKYTNDSFLRFLLLSKLSTQYPLLKPVRELNKDKLLHVRRGLVDAKLSSELIKGEQLMSLQLN